MLLTLSAKSLSDRLADSKDPLTLFGLPAFGKEELGLQGLNVQTSFLKGWELSDIDRLRDEGDKAGCPCLLLVEEHAHDLGTPGPDAAGALDRMERVLRVANRLGCSSVAMTIEDKAGPDAADLIATRLKEVVARAERFEMNLLLGTGSGFTSDPEQLTALIRKVGGFRIGAFPDFETASEAEDPGAYLRGLTPYASVVNASFCEFDARGRHKAFDLELGLEAITSVGFEGSLSLEWRGKGDPVPNLHVMRDLVIERVEASQSK